MTLRLVSIDGGVADLRGWGTLELTGAAAAVIEPRHAPDIEIHGDVAAELANSRLVLDDTRGDLLVLPCAGDAIAHLTLTMTDEPCSVTSIPRDPDAGMRFGALRLMDDEGVLFMTERSLLRFDAVLHLAWRVDDDFLGWELEHVAAGRIELASGDWSGNEWRQVRSLADGRRVG
jgi:hypothetical protein